LQHGCDHSLFEFGSDQRADIANRLEQGTAALIAAGFRQPQTFVAPYDRFSRVSLSEVAKRFNVISAGWFELRRLPYAWWPQYVMKKMLKRPHWKVGRTILLTHPGCLLSYQRSYPTMLESVKKQVESQRLTVLVNHWWEYFRDGKPDTPMIGILHATAEWLASNPNVRVISFDDLAALDVPYARTVVTKPSRRFVPKAVRKGLSPPRLGHTARCWRHPKAVHRRE